jgi:RNA polymerase sigma factor (sigma-70 family)
VTYNIGPQELASPDAAIQKTHAANHFRPREDSPINDPNWGHVNNSAAEPKRTAGPDELVTRYRLPLLRFFTRRLRSSPDPDDLVQEVFVRLMRHENMSTVQHLDGYVFQVAANVLRDHARRWSLRSEEVHHAQIEDVEIEGGFSPERVLLGQEALERLIDALQELPERTQVIFALYHFESVPQVDVARRLQMPLSTVEKHMSRANAHLLARLGPLP